MPQNQAKISWRRLLDSLQTPAELTELTGLSGTAVSYALSQLAKCTSAPLVVVTRDRKDAEQLLEGLDLFLGASNRPRLFFPPYHITAYKRLAFHNETAARRIKTLYQMIEGQHPPLTVTTMAGLLQLLLPKDVLVDFCELLLAGEEADRDAVVRKLIAGGYTRTALVEEHGDFSLRGGILDIFAPLYDDPLRIEFFGDTVESIRRFSADTQRTLGEVTEAVIAPAREAIVQRARLKAITGRIRTLSSQIGMPVTQVRQIMSQIKEEGVYPGMESLLPLIYSKLDTFFDYCTPNTLQIMIEPGTLAQEAAAFGDQIQGSYQKALEQKRLCVSPDQLYLDWNQVQSRAAAFSQIHFKSIATVAPAAESIQPPRCDITVHETDDLRQAIELTQRSQQPFEPLVRWLETQKEERRTVFIVCRRPSNVPRLKQVLTLYGLRSAVIEHVADALTGQGRIYLICGPLSSGFCWPEAAVAVLSDIDIFGTPYRPRKAPTRPKASELLNFEDLKQGDWVVHSEHGIGRYAGLTKLNLDGAVNDFLLLVYRDDDKLYLPVERMGRIQKYMGVEGVAPAVDKMGGKSWERIKRSVKRTTEKIAGELLKLYASRKIQKGHAFGEADTHFRDFEDGFPYEETTDQEKAIQDVLDDMRQSVPMDRLVCGDVGYGKTEVALRAAFLAVSEAKQAAVLVPTTVLAEQHFASFKDRFERYPVNVACLSRFRPPKEQHRIVEEIGSGRVDIVIGTHRLLQKDVAFKELGLLVLDEEQRFGVRHKEKIKRMRKSVDVLTLTATPIPRTLHLSMLGIRDISVINTPPEERRPIRTYISEFDDAIIAEAVRKELGRKGQIFFVHNSIQSLDRMAEHLQQLVPEVRLGTAHGRMAEPKLEKVMLDFMQRRIDMLVCTTIIESGLDVPSANTILINRADRFGLSQIYQLRGRVGRSDEQAYAYMFIPNESTLTKDAQKRLKVLMEYSDLGSGFQIAMSDLKIRGGGTILGASQSGHIAAVGYDMFLKLMETSIAEIKGEPIQEDLDPEINLSLSAFLPETYVADIDQRLSLYRRLAKLTDLKEISALKAEMTDRFGVPPDEATNLLLKIMLKVLAVRAGVKRLDMVGSHLRLWFSEAHQKRPFGIVEMVGREKSRYRFSPDHTFSATLGAVAPTAQLAQVKNILIEIGRHVNH